VEKSMPQSIGDTRRHPQKPTAKLTRLLDLLTVFFLTRFTKRPLRFFGALGMSCILGGVAWLAVLLLQKMFGVGLADRPALLLSSLLVAVGLQVLAIGLVGELLVFLHGEAVKDYRIREVIDGALLGQQELPIAAAPPPPAAKTAVFS